jgi:hypothetical protein
VFVASDRLEDEDARAVATMYQRLQPAKKEILIKRRKGGYTNFWACYAI